jgi:hypothetical protein
VLRSVLCRVLLSELCWILLSVLSVLSGLSGLCRVLLSVLRPVLRSVRFPYPAGSSRSRVVRCG